MKILLLTSSCLAGLAIPMQAAAAQTIATDSVALDQGGQAGAPEDQAATAEEPQEGINDIEVTANRRSESSQRAAVALTAVSGDAMRDAGITRPQELTQVIPSLQVATSAGPYALFYLRGVGNFNGNALSDAAVAFNYNGVYIGRPSSTTGFFYDLERLEVLKGPQGTLYGRNATGGAINVITRAPQLGETSGELMGEYGNYDAIRLDGSANVALGDIGAMRVAGVLVSHDGYMNDGTDDQEDAGGRVSFRVQPNADLNITLSADYFHQGGRGPGSTIIVLDPDNRIGITSPQGQAFYQTQRVSIAGRNFNPVLPRQSLDNDYWGMAATVELQTGIGTLTVLPAYREGHIDMVTTTPGFQITQIEDDKQFSVEARLASSEDHPLRYLLGAFYFDETNSVPLYQVNSQYNGSFQRYRSTTESLAFFGRLTYAFTPDIRATIGGRYTTEEKTFQGNLLSLNRLCLPIPTALCPNAPQFPYNTTTPPPVVRVGNSIIPQFDPVSGTLMVGNFIDNNTQASYNRFTWRAAADWDVTPRNLLYASYETGFKSGGFFFSNDSGVYQPERIEAFTLGSKNRFFNNRLQVNLELFHWRYSNQQISHLGTDSLGTIIFPTENVGRATFTGVEIESQFLVAENTLLRADVQYLDANYGQFVYRVPTSYSLALTGCRLAGATATLFTLDCSGFRPPNAPKWTVNLGIQQTIPLANGGRFILNGRTHFQSRTLTGLEFIALEYQSSYWLADASITYSSPSDRFFVTGFVNNMFDETVVGNTFPPPLSGFVVGSLRPPRTYGVRAGIRF